MTIVTCLINFTVNLFNAKKNICIKYCEPVKLNEHVILDGNVISWHPGVRHVGNFFNSCLDINVGSNRKCSHCIGYGNYMMSKFGHLILRVLLLYLNLIVVLFMVNFYGNISDVF